MGNRWFLFFLRRSITQRRGRFLIAAFAVMLTVSVASALAELTLGMRDKVGAELRQYGANMIVTDRSGGEIDLATAGAIRDRREWIRDSNAQVYGTAAAGAAMVEITGMETGKMSGFRLAGALPKGPAEAMAGRNLRDVLGIKEGSLLVLGGEGAAYRITAIFEKGTDADSTVVLPLESAQRLLGRHGVSALLLSADPGRVKDVSDRITRDHPSLSVKTLKQVAVAEERVLGRIQFLMLLVTVVVLFSSVIALGSTMGANVIERREELGLMKAIGATRADIGRFFIAEAGLAGLGGAGAGYPAGTIVAEMVSKAAFGSFIPVHAYLLPASVLLGVLIAVLATAAPVRNAMKTAPARILRGE